MTPRPSINQGALTQLPDEYYEGILSNRAKARKPAPIWSLMAAESTPGVLSMLAGKPNPETFPFESIQLTIRSPSGGDIPSANVVIRDNDLDAALQYGLTPGLRPLLDWLEALTIQVHERSANEGWRCSLGAGGQDLLYKVFTALLNPGDTLIVEGPTYPGATPLLDGLGLNFVTIDVDENGIKASELAKVLESWDVSQPRPKALYTIPFGSNPAGVTATYERRVEILELARKYDFLILEDDPYYFIYYGDAPRPASYFSLERKLYSEVGRVLRFDSFSKILSAGFRVGWLTGPHALLKVVEAHNMITVVHASSIAQAIILKVLQEWGIDGFLQHTQNAANFYRRRRDVMAAALQRHLTGLADWTLPDAAMFFWVRLYLASQNQREGCSGGEETDGDATAFIRSKAFAGGVLALPGGTSYLDGRQTTRVRLSFSALSDQEIDEAIRRLAMVLKSERVGERIL